MHPFSIESLTSPSPVRVCRASVLAGPRTSSPLPMMNSSAEIERLGGLQDCSADSALETSAEVGTGGVIGVNGADGAVSPHRASTPRSVSPAPSEDSGRGTPEHLSQGEEARDNSDEKPPHSYIALISMAILSSPERKLVLSDIYAFIQRRFKYYDNDERAWRNSIRHNLSLNECFIKAGRAENGKGNYWAIHPACVEDFAKGDFRRRQARRRARTGMLDTMALTMGMPFAAAAHYHRYAALNGALPPGIPGYLPMAPTSPYSPYFASPAGLSYMPSYYPPTFALHGTTPLPNLPLSPPPSPAADSHKPSSLPSPPTMHGQLPASFLPSAGSRLPTTLSGASPAHLSSSHAAYVTSHTRHIDVRSTYARYSPYSLPW